MISKFFDLFRQESPYERALSIIEQAEKVALPSGLGVNALEDKYLLVGDLILSDSKTTILFDNQDKNVVFKKYNEIIFMSEDEGEIKEIRDVLYDLHNRMLLTEENNRAHGLYPNVNS